MNKKLIALAIAGAFAAPLAMADNGNVVIYGEVGVSADNVDGGSYSPTSATPRTGGIIPNASSSERRGRISSNNSFIGFKGSEDLGDDWSAIWQIETGVAMDQQNINDNGASPSQGAQSRRNTFAGLSNKNMGTLTFGLQDTPYKTSTGPLDAFGQHTLADYRSIWGSVGPANVASIRAQNSVLYTSPNLGGFTIKAMGAAQNETGNDIGTATGTTTVSNPHYYSVSGIYANGPLYAALAYEDNKSVAAPLGPVSSYDFTYKNWRAGVGYSFSGFKVGLGYERIKGDGTGGAAATAVTSINRDAWYLPVSYQLGSNTFKLTYTKAGKSKQTNAAGADLSGSDGANQWSLGVNHAMSKRTSVYALYTQVRNDSNGFYSLGGGATGVASVVPASYGADPRAISIGMITSF